jgi:chromosome segregation ATPase
MIFKTFNSDIDSSIYKIGIFGKSFGEVIDRINDRKADIDGLALTKGIDKKKEAKKQVGSIWSYLGKDEHKDALTGEFTAFKELMDETGLGADELAKQVGGVSKSVLDYAKSDDVAKLSTEGFKASIGNLSIGAKAGQVALKGLALAGNMVVGILAGFVISKAIEGLDNLVHAADNAKESAESFSSSFSSMNDEFSSNDDKLSDLQKKYDELSKGVNSLGENVSLTTDQYDEYKQVVSEISDMMPNLLARYDDEGKKIGFVQGKLSNLNAEYDKYKKNKAMALVNGENDNGDSINDVFKNYQYQTAHIDANGNAVGKRKLIGSSNYEKIGQLQAEINSGYDGVFGQNKLTNADIEKKTALIQKYQSEIDASVSAIQDALSAIAQSGNEYYKLSDQEQQFLDTYINSLSQNFIDENNLTNETNARTFINNLINDIESGKPEIMKAYNDLFSFNIDDTDLSPEEVQKKVNELIQQLAKALGEDNWQDLKIRLGFEFVDDNVKNYKNTIKRFKDSDKIKDFFNKEGINTQKEIDAFNDVTKGINDADKAIQAYKQSVQQAQADTEELGNTLADINKTKSGIGGLFDKYEQNEGYLTQDEVASVLETNPEYIQYLVKVGDQYKLNEQALNDWNEANKEQEQEINNQMGGNDYLGNYSSLLDSIQDNASHPNGGVGNTNIGSQLDDLINKNKEWNTSLQNGEITTAQYFQNMSNAITDSGLEDALHSLNGTFDDSTDYIEETVSVLTTQLSDGLTQSTKRFEEGQTSVQDYIKEINAGSDAEKKLLASTYNLDISQETGKASLDGLSDSALEAAQSYNSLVDSQNALASTSGFVDVLSQNADFLSQYTDEAGNLMDSIFDDSRFNDYISNMSNSIVDFANQNADTMDQTASWLADTAGMSVEQASSIIAQGGDAVQGAVGNSLSGVQSMTSYAMSQVGSATSNAASAVGNVLTSLGNMISNFSYKITAKPFMQGKSKMAWDPKKGLDVSLPTFGFDISGSGGKSVSAFATSIKNAGSAISKYGASQSASAAFNNINSYKPKNTLSANKPSSYRPTYKPKSSGKSGSGGSGGSGGKNSGGDAEKQNEEYLDKFMAYQKALLEAGKITYQQYSQYVSDELERMYKNGKISASKYYSAVKDMIDEQKSIYDAALKGVTKLLDDEIDKWKDKIDVIEKNNDKLNEQKDKYDSILSAIQKVYDDEIKKANKKKDSIQDVIDAMSDENDEYERQKKLQEAIYNLNKANSQKTKYLLKDGQFVYSTDNSAIRDAQDSLHDAKYDVDVANLKKQQDDIDNYIDTLNEFKDKWNEISDAFSEAQDTMNLKQYLGSEYQRIILSNNLADIENFKNQYVAIESQINSNEQLKTSYEEKVDYYNNLKQQWEDCTSKYDDEKNKLYASQILGANWEAEVLSGRQQTLANFTSEYERLCQRQADATVNAYNTEVQAAKNAAAGIASVSSSVASSGGGSSSGGSSGGSSSSTHKVTYDKNNNPNKPALKSNDYWTYEKLSKKGYFTSGQASSHISDYASKGANGFTQIGNKYFIVKWIANAGSPANASKAKNKLEKDNPKKKGKYGYAKRYHKGLELGKIEALPKDKAFDLVQDIGTNGLEADEVPIIAKKGEAVLTEEQIENLAKTLHLVPVQNEIMEKMSKISLGDLPMNAPKMNFDANKVGQNVTRNNFAPSVTLNLNCPNVSSVSDAKAITNVVDKQLNKFVNDFYQASLHYINRK